MVNRIVLMYYYPAMDYDGWCVFATIDKNDVNRFMDYPFVTTCPDVCKKVVESLRKRNVDICVPRGF